MMSDKPIPGEIRNQGIYRLFGDLKKKQDLDAKHHFVTEYFIFSDKQKPGKFRKFRKPKKSENKKIVRLVGDL